MLRGAGSDRTTLAALGAVLVLLAVVALFPRLLGGAAMVGREAPAFSLPLVANGESLGEDADKGSLALGALRGRPVLLDFWATWCGPCRAEAPLIDRLSKRWRDAGVVVVGVNVDTPDQGDPAAYARTHELSYPIVHDAAGDTTRAYDVESLPTLVVVSRMGKVLAVRTGIAEEAELDGLVRQAL